MGGGGGGGSGRMDGQARSLVFKPHSQASTCYLAAMRWGGGRGGGRTGKIMCLQAPLPGFHLLSSCHEVGTDGRTGKITCLQAPLPGFHLLSSCHEVGTDGRTGKITCLQAPLPGFHLLSSCHEVGGMDGQARSRVFKPHSQASTCSR